MRRTRNVEQRTIKQGASFVGIGLHTGRKTTLTVRPSHDTGGIFFLRTDVESGNGLIAARWYNVSDTTLSTTITNNHGVSVSTIEHLMAALMGCGIDNALIEIDGPEVPIMDGSAEPFTSTFEKYGTVSIQAPRNAIWIQQPIEVCEGDKYALILPYPKQRITLSIDFPQAAIGSQTYSIELENEAFLDNIARSRTFGFTEQIKQLQRRGMAKGGSLKNAILVDGGQVINPEGLRFKDEFVRHKVLDAFGDLSLAGVPIIGHYYAHKAGHSLNKRLIQKLFESRAAWTYITVNEYEQMMGTTLDGEKSHHDKVSSETALHRIFSRSNR
ncbi:MAG: UDP-3-O-acyl-N-acetylglucosamine deacetylase [Candidatus Thiodiazotropha sp. (ex Monitilora ramsayi)]|nr:UDP-3-O-acyl-N-acetylglucosamine deacetylase [Candidatus Thiodiazotropha sp. (ex Monitilora ramsayi)]